MENGESLRSIFPSWFASNKGYGHAETVKSLSFPEIATSIVAFWDRLVLFLFWCISSHNPANGNYEPSKE
jgi:hypothetical protein